jgi:hypothetical protein
MVTACPCRYPRDGTLCRTSVALCRGPKAFVSQLESLWTFLSHGHFQLCNFHHVTGLPAVRSTRRSVRPAASRSVSAADKQLPPWRKNRSRSSVCVCAQLVAAGHVRCSCSHLKRFPVPPREKPGHPKRCRRVRSLRVAAVQPYHAAHDPTVLAPGHLSRLE